jgi:hypothetical protein
MPHPDQIEVFEERPVEHVHPDDGLLVVIAVAVPGPGRREN